MIYNNNCYRFFHDQLPDDWERGLYCAIETGIREYQSEIHYMNLRPDTPNEKLFSIVEFVYNDHPEFFYLDLQRSTFRRSAILITFLPVYRKSHSEAVSMLDEMNRVRRTFISECFPSGLDKTSDIKKEKMIFDWLTKNIEYDHNAIEEKENNIPAAKAMAWNAYGALVLKKAVCHGISCAFKYFCDELNVPSIVVTGQTDGGRHAWNLVKINQRFYHVDCTWDLRSSVSFEVPYVRYRYFNLSDKVITTNHIPDISFLPKCNSIRDNPFFYKGFCAKNYDDLFSVCKRKIIEEHRNRFGILCSDYHITEEQIRELSFECSKLVKKEIIWYLDNGGYFIGFRVVPS